MNLIKDIVHNGIKSTNLQLMMIDAVNILTGKKTKPKLVPIALFICSEIVIDFQHNDNLKTQKYKNKVTLRLTLFK